jgi:BirA family biotin operon repressor/biotin-[acetyl-CoA-carboxylase] ligase
MTSDEILAGLTTSTFGRQLHVHASLGSTNDRAKKLASQGAPEGSVVVALDQTNGRGRQERSWISEPGKNLTFSVILRPRIRAELLGVVSLYAAAATAAAVSALAGKRAGCKWPNDVVIGGKKVSGILCESTITGTGVEAVIAGIGVNVNQREFPPSIASGATSIALESGSDTDLAAALRGLLESLESLYRPADNDWPGSVLEAWTARNVILGSRVEARRGASMVTGIARSVTPTGALRIETDAGPLDLSAGDVHLL